jgi:AhpD family alkylhydroperoxidase
MLIEPPASVPFWLRPGLWITKKITGKDPLPARLLTHAPKMAVAMGIYELLAAHGPGDLDSRTLAVARIVASRVAGCPFCVDMNAASWKEAGLAPEELALLFSDDAVLDPLGAREAAAARYACALSATPVVLDAALGAALTSLFSPRELVVLAATIAQVNAWSRFNQGLGVPAAGFFDERACPVPLRLSQDGG